MNYSHNADNLDFLADVWHDEVVFETCYMCHANVVQDEMGTWIDDTDGDACLDSAPHMVNFEPYDEGDNYTGPCFREWDENTSEGGW